MTERLSKTGMYGHVAVWAAIFCGLYLISLQGYLLFHTAVELFSIAVAWDIFFIAWNSRRLLDNNYLLFLGISYLFVGSIDLLHTLAYKGMGVFPASRSDLASQLWIAGRFVQSVSLLIAPLFLGRRLRVNLVIAAFLLVSAALLASIFYWKVFPDTHLEGVGLTAFKIWSEYGICLILVVSAILLLKHRDQFEPDVLKLLIGSIGVTIASELAFTLYVDVYGLFNLIGHFLKVMSFYLVYRAIIQTGLISPTIWFSESSRKNKKPWQSAWRICKDTALGQTLCWRHLERFSSIANLLNPHALYSTSAKRRLERRPAMLRFWTETSQKMRCCFLTRADCLAQSIPRSPCQYEVSAPKRTVPEK